MAELTDEDRKLVTLARAARARIDAPEGAAVRDLAGRAYAAASVSLPSVTIDALALAVAQAVSAGANGLEAAAVVSEQAVRVDVSVAADLGGAGVPIYLADRTGTVVSELTT